MLIKISEITVKTRVRKDLGDLDALKDSLRTYGLIHPITLNADYELVAGERRLAAAKAIGWETINAIVLDKNITPVQQLELELEENNQRKEFTNEELLSGYEKLENLRHPALPVRIGNAMKHFFIGISTFFKKPFSRTKLPAPPKK